ncbi:MAG: glycosyltransferase family protein [Chloroflexota bacterium]
MRQAVASGLIPRSLSYSEQRSAWLGLAFGTADFYSRNLQQSGNQAEDVIANCAPLQLQWAREQARSLWAQYPLAAVSRQSTRWLQRVLSEQIAKCRPDVLYVHDINWMGSQLLKEAKPHVKLIIGQIACPLSQNIDLSAYDLIVTSFPHYVERFRRAGIHSEYLKLAFESTLLDRLATTGSSDAVFVGGYVDPVHDAGTRLLEEVARHTPVDFWGFGAERLSKESPIRRRYHGEAWGLSMYQVLRNAKIVLNRHSSASEGYANNMRLYEASGTGAMVLTDAKANLADILEPGKEVITYDSARECVDQIRYHLEHVAERERVAAAGQRRTLREHSYARRMSELMEILTRYV